VPEALVIADTGPLVAFLVKEDAHHAWARERFKDLPAPFVTCEPVLTETFHLVSRLRGGSRCFFDLVGSGLLTVDWHLLDHVKDLRRLVSKYADLPMSLADACLVRLAEIHSKASVFTVDSHFKIYRKHGRQLISTIMP
jgi:predicted nucleic acid-binding protein